MFILYNGWSFIKKDIEILRHIYFIVDFGIIGITEVIEKVSNPCLEKIMLDQKKEYLVLRNDIKNLLEEYDEKPKNLGPLTRISNDLYTNIKLLKNENDEKITKMMLEGTNKGIIEAMNILHNEEYHNEEITKILKRLIKFLENNERELKKYL